jgi:hypothetical protein
MIELTHQPVRFAGVGNLCFVPEGLLPFQNVVGAHQYLVNECNLGLSVSFAGAQSLVKPLKVRRRFFKVVGALSEEGNSQTP